MRSAIRVGCRCHLDVGRCAPRGPSNVNAFSPRDGRPKRMRLPVRRVRAHRAAPEDTDRARAEDGLALPRYRHQYSPRSRRRRLPHAPFLEGLHRCRVGVEDRTHADEAMGLDTLASASWKVKRVRARRDMCVRHRHPACPPCRLRRRGWAGAFPSARAGGRLGLSSPDGQTLTRPDVERANQSRPAFPSVGVGRRRTVATPGPQKGALCAMSCGREISRSGSLRMHPSNPDAGTLNR